MTNYVERLQDRITQQFPYLDEDEKDYYTLLILSKGENVTGEDIHHVKSILASNDPWDNDPEEYEDLPGYMKERRVNTARSLKVVSSQGPDMVKLRAILASIHANPGSWNQGSWADVRSDECKVSADNGPAPECGTAFCFAGWDAFKYAPSGTVIDKHQNVISPDGNEISISFFARTDLNLSDYQADCLFGGSNTLSDIESMVDELETNPNASRRDLQIAARDRAQSDLEQARATLDKWDEKL